jgi:heme A synthase
MTILEMHGRLADTSLYYFILLSVWGYWRFFRKQGIDPSYWGAVVIGEILLLLQSGLGGYMWVLGLRPARWAHYLYGIVGPMALPMVYMYTRGRQNRPEMLMYATTTLITMGLILRAMSTAGA